MTLSPGSRLGPYEIVAPLGSGGMGSVYRATDSRLGRQVAIKSLRSDLSANAALRQQFEREARAAASLNHPHICTLHDIGDHEGQAFLVMELLEAKH
jgi:eukaryotic-like serine/threonine-protein kinase